MRNYFAYDKSTQPQTKSHQINTLSDVNASLQAEASHDQLLVDVKNGYTKSDAKRIGSLNKTIAGLDDKKRGRIMASMQVGVQRHTQVTCTRLATGKDAPWYEVSAAADPLLVTQVYASALSVNYAIADGKTTKEDWAPFARLVLDAAYEATLHAAVLYARPPEANGRRKVVLTALGGGVFGNEPAWISAAIVRALKIFKNAGLDVAINEYGTGHLADIKTAIEADEETRPLLQKPESAKSQAFGREANEANKANKANKAKPRPVVMYTE